LGGKCLIPVDSFFLFVLAPAGASPVNYWITIDFYPVIDKDSLVLVVFGHEVGPNYVYDKQLNSPEKPPPKGRRMHFLP